MTEIQFATAVRAVIDNWMLTTPPGTQLLELAKSNALAAKLGAEVLQKLLAQGYPAATVRNSVLRAPCFHLQGAFDASDLADTPIVWFPVPDTPGTIAGRAAALAAQSALGLETVSYGSENEGTLFVNLVALPGEGALAERSIKSMRGHTDAVSFPFSGEDDPANPRIAPSPDIVTLVGLRNPRDVATKLMSLHEILKKLEPGDVLELKKPQFSIRSQRTFVKGTKAALGAEHVVVAASILADTTDGDIHIRYSHSSVIAAAEDASAKTASANLELACNDSVRGIALKPGDILLVNNRLSLHGRAEVGEGVGEQSRWLLRTYGLNTVNLPTAKRKYQGEDPTYVLFP
jgi:L-asparagine oxygenase